MLKTYVIRTTCKMLNHTNSTQNAKPQCALAFQLLCSSLRDKGTENSVACAEYQPSDRCKYRIMVNAKM